MQYLDKIQYIRRGGSSRNGKCPDRLVDVIFLRQEDTVTFSFLYPNDESKAVGQGKLNDIVSVNGAPI